VAAVGDIACSPQTSSCGDNATAALINARDPAALFVLGDAQYDSGTLAEFWGSYDQSYGRFLPKTFPVPGNHEYKTSGASGYYRYFGTRAHGSPGYYAFNHNGWRIYALNSNCSEINCTAERSWMVADIKDHRADCQAMIMHHPRYSSGAEHGSSTVPRRFWTVALDSRFELALAGHDHSYERFARMDADGNVRTSGIQSFVSGLGGKSRYGFGARVPGSKVRYNSKDGVLFLGLRAAGYSWDFRSVDDISRDSGSASCR